MSTLQGHWDARAATNFILGGAGSGLVIFSLLVPQPAALALGLAMIAAGLGTVWLEIGRKLRAIHVFFNPFTSWMTRESFAALAVFALGIAFFILEDKTFHTLTAIAAGAFLWCQGRILHAAKGIAAWRAPEVVPLIVTTGLAEGAALALLFAPDPWLIAALALAVAARLVAWRRYRRAAPSAALEQPGTAIACMGTLLVLAFAAFAAGFPGVAPLAAASALVPGWWLKFALVTRAAFKQDFSLPHLPVRGSR